MKFALDAFETTQSLPTASVLWRELFRQVQALKGEDRDRMIGRIVEFRPPARDADWLRLSALHYLTGEWRWLADQARLADSTSSTDALMELIDCAWTSILSRAKSRAQMAAMAGPLDLPRLQRLAAQRLEAPSVQAGPAPLPAPDARGPKVAVYTPQIANPRHGGTLFTLNIASALAASGARVQVFSAQESEIALREAYNGASIAFKPPALEPAELIIHALEPVPIVLPVRGHSVQYKMRAILGSIAQFAPDWVVFVGSLSPVVYRLWERHPVIGLSVNTLAPVVPVDVWLCARPDPHASAWPGLPTPHTHRFPFRFWPDGSVAPASREAMQVPADAVVLITAGFRLPDECAPPWSDRVLRFLDEHPKAWWVLLGTQAARLHPTISAHPRVRVLPPERLAAPWYAMADIYLNPPRIGGGGSVAQAMEQGLAVASLGDCDGGDKIGPLAAPSVEACFAQLSQWTVDAKARQAVGEQLRTLYRSQLDMSSPQAAQGLREAGDSARSVFQARHSNT